MTSEGDLSRITEKVKQVVMLLVENKLAELDRLTGCIHLGSEDVTLHIREDAQALSKPPDDAFCSFIYKDISIDPEEVITRGDPEKCKYFRISYGGSNYWEVDFDTWIDGQPSDYTLSMRLVDEGSPDLKVEIEDIEVK